MTQDMDLGKFEGSFLLAGVFLETHCKTQMKLYSVAPVNNQFIFLMFIGFNK